MKKLLKDKKFDIFIYLDTYGYATNKIISKEFDFAPTTTVKLMNKFTNNGCFQKTFVDHSKKKYMYKLTSKGQIVVSAIKEYYKIIDKL